MLRLAALVYALFLGAILLDALMEVPASNYVQVTSVARHFPAGRGP